MSGKSLFDVFGDDMVAGPASQPSLADILTLALQIPLPESPTRHEDSESQPRQSHQPLASTDDQIAAVVSFDVSDAYFRPAAEDTAVPQSQAPPPAPPFNLEVRFPAWLWI